MTGQSERHKHHDKVRALLKETGVKLTHLRDHELSRISINAFRRGDASFMTLIKMEEAIKLMYTRNNNELHADINRAYHHPAHGKGDKETP